MQRHILLTAVLLALLMTTGGCATIVGDSTEVVRVNSTPGDAAVEITDEKGVKVFKATTPVIANLPKSDGSYWGKKSYTVEVSKAGYESRVFPITASPTGWYIAGNAVFGGLIGWFLVDPFKGEMYNLHPDQISVDLARMEGPAADNVAASQRDDGPAEPPANVPRAAAPISTVAAASAMRTAPAMVIVFAIDQDPREWAQQPAELTPSGASIKLLPGGQTLDSWTEMVVLETTYTDATPAAFVAGWLTELHGADPQATYSQSVADDGAITLEYASVARREKAIRRFIAGTDGVYTATYKVKQSHFDPAGYDLWRSIIADATLEMNQ